MVTAWLEKAERLRTELARQRSASINGAVDDPARQEQQERALIAQWLRAEFSDEPPEDTHTLALFPRSLP